jgi:hypothetical protein
LKLTNPWPSGKKINTGSPFGWRSDPFTKKRKYHKGIDVAGTFPVTSAGEGKVVHNATSWHSLTHSQKLRQSGGNVVIIQHENNLFTAYYHGAERSKLNVGDRVKAGDFIYTSGSTGRSTGAHLHFEVRTSKSGGQVDPVPYLNAAPSAPVDVKPQPLKVDGRLTSATWKAFQQALKSAGHYTGIPDGRPGTMTYKAVQSWAGAKADGIFGPNTRKAVQKKLGVTADGKWGRLTISALQRAINAGGIK